jgi:uncharacterized protein (TIGR03435 family)
MPSRIRLVIAAASILLIADWPGTSAQSPAEPRFEVASVKPNNRDDGQISVSYQNGRYTATGIPLELLIRSAYQVQEFQIVGGPNWMRSDRFDIMAVAGSPAPAQQPLLRSLLTDRFNLVTHRETREMPVYALVLARDDGRLGPQLRPSTLNCAGAPRGSQPACGTSVGPGMIRAGGRTMAELATSLSTLTNTGSSLNRMIVDRTGLAGVFDVELKFTPDNIPNALPPGTPPVDREGASIFTAVQEQLGLKLEPQRGPVEVLVIDSVSRPTPE